MFCLLERFYWHYLVNERISRRILSVLHFFFSIFLFQSFPVNFFYRNCGFQVFLILYTRSFCYSFSSKRCFSNCFRIIFYFFKIYFCFLFLTIVFIFLSIIISVSIAKYFCNFLQSFRIFFCFFLKEVFYSFFSFSRRFLNLSKIFFVFFPTSILSLKLLKFWKDAHLHFCDRPFWIFLFILLCF